MKCSTPLKRLACLGFISALSVGYAYSDVIITDFDTINPLDYAFGSTTWSTPVKQFQSFTDGSVSGQEVLPISGGDPTVVGGAGVDGFNLNLSSFTSLELTARLLATNEAGSIQISLRDSDGTQKRFSIATSNFNTTTFSSASVDFTAGTISTAGLTAGLNLAAVTGYQVQGNYYDPGGAQTAKFNVQLDNISAIPEPGSLLLISISCLAILGARKRF